MLKKNFNFELKNISDPGFFEGYASTFGVPDSENDVIVKGAFASSLASKGCNVKLLWQHQPENVIGVLKYMSEDEHGLHVMGDIIKDTEKGKEAYVLLKNGAISGLSIGFIIKESEYDQQSNIRYIYEVDLHEISIVTFPANTEAKITNIKSQNKNYLEPFMETLENFISTFNQ